MNITYIGAIWVEELEKNFQFDRALPKIRRVYPFGTCAVIGLANRGHKINIIVNDNCVDKIEVFRSENCNLYVVPSYKRTRWQFLSLFRKDVRGIRQCLSQIKPDVVFVQWTYHFAYAGVTSGFPCLVVARDSPWRCLWNIRKIGFLIKTLYSQLLVFPKIKHLSTISPHMVEDLRRFNRYKGPITIIPNGIKIEEANGKEIRVDARTIMCVSEWGRHKNITKLFKAFAIVRDRHPGWRLLAIGNCVTDEVAGEWLRNNGISDEGVELMGLRRQDEIQQMLVQEADVFCSPTLEESFGQVFLEAMAQGVPCIGGEKSGAVPWVIGDGGVVCDVTKPEELAECIEKVMGDYELRRKLSEGGMRRVREMFNIEKVVDMYESELRKIARC